MTDGADIWVKKMSVRLTVLIGAHSWNFATLAATG
jgi:hypothetical protein